MSISTYNDSLGFILDLVGSGVSKDEAPEWMKSFCFDNLQVVYIAYSIWNAMKPTEQHNQEEFRFLLKSVLRLMKIESSWA